MPSPLVYEYVYFGARGAHTRQPRGTNVYGGFTPVPGLNPSVPPDDLASNHWYTVPIGVLRPTVTVPATATDPEITCDFAFVNVSGLLEGPRYSFDYTQSPPSGRTVESTTVTVLIVYLPRGGGGPNGLPGAVIDAFDATENRLVDDDFVTVTVNGSSNAALTQSGNVNGWVETTNAPVTITASAGFPLVLEETPGIYTGFDNWRNLEEGPSTAISDLTVPSSDLTVHQGQTIYALAFYHDIVEDKSRFKEHMGIPKPTETFTWVVDIDPSWLAEIKKLHKVIAELETKFDTVIKGKAFIKEEERPDVGKFNSGT